MARFLGASLALAGLLVIVLVLVGEFLGPEPILYSCGGAATQLADGTIKCIEPDFTE